MVNPGGTGRPALVISARPAPLPPSTSFILPLPSALPPPKKNTYFVPVCGVAFCSFSSRVVVLMNASFDWYAASDERDNADLQNRGPRAFGGNPAAGRHSSEYY